MTIAVNDEDGGNGFTLSYQVTAGAGAGKLVVICGGEASLDPSGASCTYGSDGLTLVKEKVYLESGQGYSLAAIFYLDDVSVGTQTITVDWPNKLSGRAGIAALVLTGAASGGAEATAENGIDTTTAIALAITTLTDGALIVTGLATGSANLWSADAGETEIYAGTPTSMGFGASRLSKATAGAETMGWSGANSSRPTMALAAFAPAAGGGDLVEIAGGGLSLVSGSVRQASMVRPVSSALTVSASVASALDLVRVAIAAAVGVADEVARSLGRVRLVASTVGLAGSALQAIGKVRLVATSVGLASSSLQAIGKVQLVGSTVGLAASALQAIGRVRLVGSPVGLAEDVLMPMGRVRLASASVGLAEAAARARGLVRLPGGVLSLAEQLVPSRGLARLIGSSLAVQEALAPVRALVRSIASTVGIAATAARRVGAVVGDYVKATVVRIRAAMAGTAGARGAIGGTARGRAAASGTAAVNESDEV